MNKNNKMNKKQLKDFRIIKFWRNLNYKQVLIFIVTYLIIYNIFN